MSYVSTFVLLFVYSIPVGILIVTYLIRLKQRDKSELDLMFEVDITTDTVKPRRK